MNEQQRRSAFQERTFARKVEGTRQPGSGSGWKRRQDVRNVTYLFEMKRTDGKALNLKVEDLEQLHRNALMEGRVPAMHLEVGGRRYVLLEEPDFIAISGGGLEGCSGDVGEGGGPVVNVPAVPPARRRRYRTVGPTGE